MRYPGGKGKTFQHIINLMPPHRVYIETHLGGGAVLRNKLPAELSIGIDIDARVIDKWEPAPNFQLVCARAETFLAEYQFVGDECVYVDPPYYPLTRRRSRVYQHDYAIEDHSRLLSILKTIPCKVILSGYANPLYCEELSSWRTREFKAKTHTDVRLETLWFNFEPPLVLHDSHYLGANFRERQSFKRRIDRLKDKFRRMEAIERAVITNWLHEAFPPPDRRPSI